MWRAIVVIRANEASGVRFAELETRELEIRDPLTAIVVIRANAAFTLSDSLKFKI
jgi:hypothetical protein